MEPLVADMYYIINMPTNIKIFFNRTLANFENETISMPLVTVGDK